MKTNKIIDAEIVETQKAVEVTQKPIVIYEFLESINKNIVEKIESLNIDTLEPTDDNLSVIKSTRAELNKNFKEYEEQRKMAKELVLKEYNLFEDKYKKLISAPLQDADKKLKSLVDTVTDEILNLKIVGIKEYFMDENHHEWLKFEDLELKIIKSKSDKSIKDEIDVYLENVKTSTETIQTLPNSDRVLAKFQICKDLNRAISDVSVEIQREEQIKAQNEERARLQAEALERQKEAQKQAEQRHEEELQRLSDVATYDEQPAYEPEPIKEVIQEPKIDETIYQATFSVFATKAELGELKKFMIERGIKYESK